MMVRFKYDCVLFYSSFVGQTIDSKKRASIRSIVRDAVGMQMTMENLENDIKMLRKVASSLESCGFSVGIGTTDAVSVGAPAQG